MWSKVSCLRKKKRYNRDQALNYRPFDLFDLVLRDNNYTTTPPQVSLLKSSSHLQRPLTPSDVDIASCQSDQRFDDFVNQSEYNYKTLLWLKIVFQNIKYKS